MSTAIWKDCLDHIKEAIPEKSFKTWFIPIKAIKYAEFVLTIQVPNTFFYEWIEEHYLNILKKSIYHVIGPKGRLEYNILVNKPHNKAETPSADQEITNPFVIPGIKKVKLESNLNIQYTFDSYIEGDCNRLARSAGISISNKPGGTAFNPLVIYGGVGLGKTHLAHAIGNDIIKNNPDNNVLFTNSENFTARIVKAIREGSMEQLMQFFNNVDTFIVDDIQFIANRDKTQDIFFNIFNQLQQTGRQIILTSDRAPKDMEGVSDRLINRFKWGLTADLKSPDFETRFVILEQKLGIDLNLLPKDVIEYICINVKKNIRELEGVVISLLAQLKLNNREANLDLAKEVIDKFVTKEEKTISIENITKLVAEYFNVTVSNLKGKTRKRDVVVARQLSMYLAKQYTKCSLKAIGDEFGGRDHSTVIYSLNTVKDLLDTDSLFKDTLDQLERKVQYDFLL